MYDECSTDKEHTAIDPNNEQLDTLTLRVGLEHSAYLDYKVSESEIKKVVSAVEETLPKNRNHKKAEFQVLVWWELFGAYLFPRIARVARSTLCVWASSAKSENNFSNAGNTLTKKRSNLNPNIVNDLLPVCEIES